MVPQFALTNAAGQIYMITPNPGNSFNGYQFIRSPYIQAPHPLQAPPQQIQHQLSPAPPRQIEAPPPLTLPSPVLPPQPRIQSTTKIQPPPLSIEQTNARVRSIKEKCISHYIEGQLIIEITKPMTEKKHKKKKSQPQQQQPRQQKDHHNQQKQHQHKLALPSQFNQAIQPQQMELDSSQPQPQIQSPQQIQLPPQPQLQLQQPAQSQPQPKPSPNQPPKPSHPKQSQPPKRQQSNHQLQSQQQQLQQPSDLKKLRAEMENWSVSDVVKFIESHEEIKHCSAKFAEDEIDGQALLFMIDRNLNFQTSNILTSMFKIGPAMKIEATLSKYKIND